MMRRYRQELITAALAAAAWPTMILAQTAPSAAPVPGAPGTAADDRASTTIADIIVTAQRRTENAQRVPIAVTALTGNQLSGLGVRQTTDLAVAAPAVTVTNGNGNLAVTIRGIGGTGSGGDEQANGLYLDGVYLTSPAAAVFRFADVDRIEILKGPQGTLFGRNASGGAIQIITHVPTEETRAAFTGSYSNYNTYEGTGYLSGKLAQNLFASVTADYYDQTDGWGKNIFDGHKTYTGKLFSGRAKLRWAPDAATDITFAYLHTYTRNPNNQGQTIVPGQLNLAGDPNPGFYNVNNNVDQFNLDKDDNESLVISRDFGALRALSITSHDEVHVHASQDGDVSRLPLSNTIFGDIPNITYTQELQLQSEASSHIKWTVGGFYYNNDLAVNPLLMGPRVFVVHDVTKSYAGFGQTTIPIFDVNHLTVGLRYTVDDRLQRGNINSVAFPTQTATDKKLTYRFALDRQFTPGILGYASYSRGFKSGLFNITLPGAPAVKPQSVDTYEVGLKTDLFDRRVRFNVAAFDNEFKNIQVRGTLPGNTSGYGNAANARIKGVEFDVQAKPAPHLSLQGGFSYLDGKYTRYPNAPFYIFRPTGGAIPSVLDESGNRTVNTPKVAYTAAATYDIPTQAGDFLFNATYAHNSGFAFDPQNVVLQQAFGLLNLAAGWTAADGGLSAQVWARNLNNAHYFSSAGASPVGAFYQPGTPRTYGVTIGWKYH